MQLSMVNDTAEQIDASLPRVEQVTFASHSAWCKRPEPARESRFRAVHSVISLILPKVLRPTNALGGMEALRAEAERLQSFASLGLPVPQVLSITDGHIILSDCGTQMRHHLRKQAKSADPTTTLCAAIDVLLRVHHQGRAHGRPFVKDMTLNDAGDVYLLDLEEDPVARMSLADAQARDVWLFLMSCAEFYEAPDSALRDLLQRYLAVAPAAVAPRLIALGRSLRLFRRLLGLIRKTRLSQDIHGAYWAARTLEEMGRSNMADAG